MMNSAATAFSKVSREMQLLLLCAGCVNDDDGRKQGEALLQYSMDWDEFLQLTEWHRLVSQVTRRLRSWKWERFPEDIRRKLNSMAKDNALSSLALLAELSDILVLFNQNGVPVLTLKGPVMAQDLYGDPGVRHPGDLDILVPPDFVDQAGTLLENRGYHRTMPKCKLTPRQLAVFIRREQHFGYSQPADGAKVELHWKLCANPYLLPLNVDQAWNNRRYVPFAGASAATLNPEHLIHYLLVHGSNHRWFRLCWLCDVMKIFSKYQESDWTRFLHQAEQLGTLRMTRQTLLLIHRLLNFPVPEIFASGCEDKKVIRMTDKATQTIISKPKNFVDPGTRLNVFQTLCQSIKKLRYKLSLRSDLRYRFYYCYMFFGHDDHDWNLIPLPDSLFFLYPLIRPVTPVFRRASHWLKARRKNA